jgi:hypothetical protein
MPPTAALRRYSSIHLDRADMGHALTALHTAHASDTADVTTPTMLPFIHSPATYTIPNGFHLPLVDP